jgi:general stress protein YciG
MTEEEKTEQTTKKLTGFAALSPERRREIASKGGKIAHAKGTAHEFTSETARAAALVDSPKRYRFNKETAAIAGAKGGRKTRENRKETE